jgi:hypothetical protein
MNPEGVRECPEFRVSGDSREIVIPVALGVCTKISQGSTSGTKMIANAQER